MHCNYCFLAVILVVAVLSALPAAKGEEAGVTLCYNTSSVFSPAGGDSGPTCNNNEINVISNLCGTLDDGSGPRNAYSSDLNCSWKISPSSSERKLIRLRFLSLETETGGGAGGESCTAEDVCDRDGVKITTDDGIMGAIFCGIGGGGGGGSSSNKKLKCVGPLCSSGASSFFQQGGGVMFASSSIGVNFFSDSSGEMDGWQLDWKTEVLSEEGASWSLFSPQFAVSQGGMKITITGDNFVAQQYQCSFESLQQVTFVDAQVLSSSQLVCTTPSLPSAQGQVNVQVWSVNGATRTLVEPPFKTLSSSGSSRRSSSLSGSKVYFPQYLAISSVGLPDLSVSDVSIASSSSSIFIAGATPGAGAIQATIWNNGSAATAAAENVIVQFQVVLSSSAMIVPFVRGSVAVCSLDIGQSVRVSLPEGARIPTWVPAGNATIRVVVDVADRIAEISEDNNAATPETTISIVHADIADVAVERLRVDPLMIGSPGAVIHENNNVQAVIRNFGNTAARNVAVSFEVAPAASSTTTATTAAAGGSFRRLLRGSLVLCTVGAGGSVTVTLPVGARVPSAMEEGAVVVRAVVDPLGLIPDENVDNNRLRRSENNVAEQDSAIVSPKPDLVVESIVWDSTSLLTPGSSLPGLRAIVRNRGFGDASNFAVSFAAGNADASYLSPIIRGNAVAGCKLPPGASITVTAGVGAKIATSGTTTTTTSTRGAAATTTLSILRAVVDPLHKVDELFPDNNIGDLFIYRDPSSSSSSSNSFVSSFHSRISRVVGGSAFKASATTVDNTYNNNKVENILIGDTTTATAASNNLNFASDDGGGVGTVPEATPEPSTKQQQVIGGVAATGCAVVFLGTSLFFISRKKLNKEKEAGAAGDGEKGDGEKRRNTKRRASPPPPIDQRSVPLNCNLGGEAAAAAAASIIAPSAASPSLTIGVPLSSALSLASPDSVASSGTPAGMSATASFVVGGNVIDHMIYGGGGESGGGGGGARGNQKNHDRFTLKANNKVSSPESSGESSDSFEADYVVVVDGEKVQSAPLHLPITPSGSSAAPPPTAQNVAARLMTKRSRRPKELIDELTGGGGGARQAAAIGGGGGGFRISPKMPYTPVASLISPSAPEPLTPLNPAESIVILRPIKEQTIPFNNVSVK